MNNPRYDIKWAGRCTFDTSDKIWGWFLYNDPTSITTKHPVAYAFWARTGTTANFKKHVYNSWAMDKLVRDKKDRKYTEISTNELLTIWPSFYDDIDNRFIFFLLVGD